MVDERITDTLKNTPQSEKVAPLINRLAGTPPSSAEKKSWFKQQRLLLGGVFGLLIASGLGLYFIMKPAAVATEGVPSIGMLHSVEVTEARNGLVNRNISAVGTLTANQVVDMMFQVPGRIEKIHVHSGAVVSRGDALISLEDTEYSARLKEAEAKLTFAKLTLERQTQLLARNAGAAKEKEKAEAELLSAQASVDKARYDLDNTIIRASFDGVIGLINMSVGAYVKQNDKVMTLVDLDPMKVDFNVPGTFVRFITPGQKVQITIDGFENKVFAAEIEAVEPRVDSQTHSLPVRAVLDNKFGLLKAGLFGRVDLVAGTKAQVVLISDKAILTDDSRLYVYVVQKLPRELSQKYGKNLLYMAVQRYIKVGINEAGNMEVTEGLNPGEQVVIVGHHKLSGQQLPVTFPGVEEEEAAADAEVAEEARLAAEALAAEKSVAGKGLSAETSQPVDPAETALEKETAPTKDSETASESSKEPMGTEVGTEVGTEAQKEVQPAETVVTEETPQNSVPQDSEASAVATAEEESHPADTIVDTDVKTDALADTSDTPLPVEDVQNHIGDQATADGARESTAVVALPADAAPSSEQEVLATDADGAVSAELADKDTAS